MYAFSISTLAVILLETTEVERLNPPGVISLRSFPAVSTATGPRESVMRRRAVFGSRRKKVIRESEMPEKETRRKWICAALRLPSQHTNPAPSQSAD